MIIDSPIISGSQLSSGPLTQVGDVQITGSLTVSGSINGATISGSVATASYAENAGLLGNLNSGSFVATSSFNAFSGSTAGRINNLEQFSASLDATFATDASVSASILVLSQSVQNSQAALSSSFATTSGSYASASGSLSIRTSNLEATSSTLTSASSSFAAQSASLSTRLTADETNITTLTNASASFAVVSASFSSTSGSIAGRVTLIEGQYATTGSNTFTGVQYVSQASNAISFTSTASLYTDGGLRVAKDSFVSGTAYFNNITVYGTSSIEYITSSQVNIGSNVITVNTDTPAIRFGGISVFDSGSTQLTGSLFWDSEKNHWIYSNPSGSSYNSAMLMNGPRNTGSLGTEQGTTNNALMKGQGGDHITSSQMIDDGTTVQIPGNLQVTGSIVGSSTVTATQASFTATANTYAGGSLILKSYTGGTNTYLTSVSGLFALSNGGSADHLTISSTGAATFTAATQDAIQTVVRMSGNNASGQLKALDFKLTAGTPLWTISTAAVGTDAGINIMPNGSAGLSLATTGAATFSSSVTAGGELSTTSGLISISGGGGAPPTGGVGLRYVSNRLIVYGGSTDFTVQKNSNAGPNLTILESGAATFSSSVQVNGAATTTPLGVKTAANQNWRLLDNSGAQFDCVNDALSARVDFRIQGDNYFFGSGRVGLGQSTDAGYKLDVNGTGRFSGNVLISKSNDATVEVNSTTATSYSAFFHSESGTAKAYWEYCNSTFSDSTRRNYLEAYNLVGGFAIYTANAKALDIASTGAATFSGKTNVVKDIADYAFTVTNTNTSGYGMYLQAGGTNNAIDVYNASGATQIFKLTGTGAATFNSSVTAIKDGAGNLNTNITGSQLILSRTSGINEVLAFRNTGASNGISGLNYAAQIIADGNNAAEIYTTAGSPLILGTSATERMRITSGGFLKASNTGTYINATSTFHEISTSITNNNIAYLSNTAASPYGPFIYFPNAAPNNTTNYFLQCADSTVNCFTIWSNGTTSGRSDIRLKKNVADATPKLDKLMQLRVVNYEWKESIEGGKELGLIAQEVEEVFPNLVITEPIKKKREIEQEDGNIIEEEYIDGDSKSVKNSVLPYITIKALQELTTLVQEQQAQIEALKTEINELKNKVGSN